MQGWAPARIEGLKPTSGTVRKTMRSAACECSDGARTSSVGYHQPAAASEDHCTDLRATFSGKPLKFQRSSSIHDATQRLTLRPRCYCPRRRLSGAEPCPSVNLQRGSERGKTASSRASLLASEASCFGLKFEPGPYYSYSYYYILSPAAEMCDFPPSHGNANVSWDSTVPPQPATFRFTSTH